MGQYGPRIVGFRCKGSHRAKKLSTKSCAQGLQKSPKCKGFANPPGVAWALTPGASEPHGMTEPTSPTLAPQPAPAGGRWAVWASLAVTLLGSAALAMLLQPGALGAGGSTPHPPKKAPAARAHFDHQGLMAGPFSDGPAVTAACLRCHPNAGSDMLHSSHFTWLSEPTRVPGAGKSHAQPQRIGKRNLINNFCLSVESNWPRCTNCHAGYGWKDASFTFNDVNKVDCLVCHEQTGSYRKGLAGLPPPEVDLVRVAGSVARPTRENCGTCHFSGGGGDGVKHGDLDPTLIHPHPSTDVHMGRANMACVDCHRTSAHQISGESLGVGVGARQRVTCTQCHEGAPHRSERLNAHLATVACESCHVPLAAPEMPTKMLWDWSTAGQNVSAPDPHVYLKEKGSFVYATRVVPEYYWWDGTAERYLKGDPVELERGVDINRPLGGPGLPHSLIYPFKVHRGKQPFDTSFGYLLVPKTYGRGGYWSEFDWKQALSLGSEATGLPFSGNYGFVQSRMFWPLSHMIPPASSALGCKDCHSSGGRLDWARLGYDGDPAFVGSKAKAATNHEGQP